MRNKSFVSYPNLKQNPNVLFSIPVLVAALGYFVDIFDLLLFTIVREPSLRALGVQDAEMVKTSTYIINWQMFGLLLGGIIWGVLGDKKGRLSVLFGSIILYSIANIITGFVQNANQYALLRFIGGIGLAGELGAGITLVSELLPKEKRGIGTSIVAGIGLSGAVAAYYTFQLTQNWQMCYWIGGILGLCLLALRIKVSESGMFKSAKEKAASRGNFFILIRDGKRFKKYIFSILIGLPNWFVIGILINLSNRFAKELYGGEKINSGKAIMLAYAGISIGDIMIGLLSQKLKSRKNALYIFYALSILATVLYFSIWNNSNNSMYFICTLLGFATGFWAIFVTMGAEQFGTNIRATAATTIPNFARGTLPLINLFFVTFLIETLNWSLILSGIITAILVWGIGLFALIKTEETFHKDLDYIES